MQATPTGLPGVMEVRPSRHEDSRGYFSETFRRDWFSEFVAPDNFVQDNQSMSIHRGTIRGLHAQTQPFAQGKLVSCIAGAIFDVAVDVRTGSASFGRWTALTLSAAEGNQLWIPPGFLHGFCALSDDCVVAYKVTNYFSREHNMGVRWDDPEIAIDWPHEADANYLSESDKRWPLLRDLTDHTTLAGH